MSIMDLSMPKELDLSLKKNDYNDNSISNPKYSYDNEHMDDVSSSNDYLKNGEESKIEPTAIIKEETDPYFNTTIEKNENDVTVCAQIQDKNPEVRMSHPDKSQSSTDESQICNLSKDIDQQVKNEPSFETGDSSSKAEISTENMDKFDPYWNSHQNVNSNQVTNVASSNTDQDIKPDMGNNYYHSYGQHQQFGNVQQFYGTFPPYQNFHQPTQLNQHYFPTNPHISQSAFHPNYNFGGPSNQFQNAPLWNGHPYPWNQFQYGNQFNGPYGLNPYIHQSSPLENNVKIELNNSNEITSDLGSSFNSSEDSFSSLDGKAEIKPTDEEIVWVPDEQLLPKGWKKRIYSSNIRNRNFFLSPTNEKFTSKSALLEHMERNPLVFSQDDMEKLKPKDSLDWIPDETLLPKGWKKRVNKNEQQRNHHFFLSPTNEKFNSKTAVLEYMDKNPSLFTQNDVHKLKSTMHKGTQRHYTNWDNSDSTLPQGWFKRHCDSVYSGKPHRDYQYLSPKQEIFLSRNAVINHMKENSYSEEDIELFLSGKSGYGGRNGKKTDAHKFHKTFVRDYTKWDDSDHTLPKGWLKRHSIYSDPNGGKHTEYQYLSPNQHKFSSRNAVVAFMSRSGQYSQEDIQLVLSGKGHSSRRL